jgi:hypothetical protein
MLITVIYPIIQKLNFMTNSILLISSRHGKVEIGIVCNILLYQLSNLLLYNTLKNVV